MKYYVTQINEKGSIAVDDTILIKDYMATAGSHILEGYVPLFSAEAVERLEKNGYEISGKTLTGEFGLDLLGEFSYYAPEDNDMLGAAAELVKAGKVKAALGVDMNGSTRRTAALSGISFLKPTYGTVSRHGVISCAASGEQIGVYAGNAGTIAEIMGVIAGHDSKDGTSLKEESYSYSTEEPIEGKRACIVKDMLQLCDDEVKGSVEAFAEELKKKGITVEEVSLHDLFEKANTAWQILMSAETCNNVSRYDGVKFGFRSEQYRNIDELYVNSRTEGLNFLTKAVILYGSDKLSKGKYKDCYDKSLRIRRMAHDALQEQFEKYDAVITPVCKNASYEKYDIHSAFEKVFEESIFTSIVNLTGVPALTAGHVQMIGKQFDESVLLSMLKSVEK